MDHDELWKILKEMGIPVKESYPAQNSLELTPTPTPTGPPHHSMQNKELSPKEKKWTLRLINPNSELVPASDQPPEFLAPAI